MSGLKGVLFLIWSIGQSVNLHRPAFDSIHPLGTTEELFAPDGDLAVLGQRDGGLAALQNQFLFGGDDQALPVLLNLKSLMAYTFDLVRGGTNEAENQWLLNVACHE